MRDEVADQFQPKTIKLVLSPQDGLPVPADEPFSPMVAPPFTRENVICVEDDREYVEIFDEEMLERGWRTWDSGKVPVVRKWTIPDGYEALTVEVRSRWDENGQEVARRAFTPSEVIERFGHKFSPDGKVPVRPIRERCKYYKRQCFANHDVPDPTAFGHQHVARNCMARKSIGGAYLSLYNEAVYACEYRDPPDPESVKRVFEDRDRERLNSGPPEMVPMFGIT